VFDYLYSTEVNDQEGFVKKSQKQSVVIYVTRPPAAPIYF